MTVRDAEPMDVYVDANNRLWRVVGTCHEPTVFMEAIEAAPQGTGPGLTRERINGGISGHMWTGFERIHRPMPGPMTAEEVERGMRERFGPKPQDRGQRTSSKAWVFAEGCQPQIVETTLKSVKLRALRDVPGGAIVRWANGSLSLYGGMVWKLRLTDIGPVEERDGCEWTTVWLDAVEPPEGAAP